MSCFRGRKRNVAKYAQAVELYACGNSTVEIARRMRTFPGVVARMLNASGVQLRSAAESKALGKRRAARRVLIAEAAQRRFGYVAVASPADKPPPVNDLWLDDDVAADTWEPW